MGCRCFAGRAGDVTVQVQREQEPRDRWEKGDGQGKWGMEAAERKVKAR